MQPAEPTTNIANVSNGDGKNMNHGGPRRFTEGIITGERMAGVRTGSIYALFAFSVAKRVWDPVGVELARSRRISPQRAQRTQRRGGNRGREPTANGAYASKGDGKSLYTERREDSQRRTGHVKTRGASGSISRISVPLWLNCCSIASRCPAANGPGGPALQRRRSRAASRRRQSRMNRAGMRGPRPTPGQCAAMSRRHTRGGRFSGQKGHVRH